MKIDFVNEQFKGSLTREELVVLISALGWTDSLVPSDKALQEYVGWPREKYRSLVGELAEAGKSNAPR